MSIEVHPSAAVFPMMTDDELADLAADIKENGLLHPIVRDADGVLIDGRNRLRACEIAGVEPSFTTLNGHDATALIVSANLNRRNLTKGQQAMALAMIYPEPAKGGRGKKALGTDGFSQARLSQARCPPSLPILS
jgi:ParB-like chromosome segregation protein Spo0J